MKNDNAEKIIVSEQWSNIRAFYVYAGTPENPRLILDFDLEISAYQPPDEAPPSSEQTPAKIPDWQQKAIDDKQKFTRLAFLLNQNHDEKNSAEFLESAFSMFLTNSLLKTEKTRLSTEDAQNFQEFIDDCLKYISERADGREDEKSPECRICIPLSLDDISAFDLIKLSLAITFEASETADQEITAVSPIDTPADQIEDLILSLRNEDDFAAAFERVFHDENWQIRLGTTEPDISEPEQEPTSDFWAIRMGKNPDAGYYYEIQKEAAFYAPKPIAETLKTTAVSVGKYTRAEHFPVETALQTFSDIDLNVWANAAFAAIDSYLSTACEADSFLSGNSEISINLDKIRNYKNTIARAVAASLIPIFETDVEDEISLTAARETLCRLLAEQLSNASVLSAMTIFKVSDVSIGRQKFSGAAAPRFSGRFIEQSASPAENEKEALPIPAPEKNFPLGDGKIQYFKVGNHNADWRLSFPFSTENTERQTALSIPLAYRLTHLEYSSVITTDLQKGEQNTLIRFINTELVAPIDNIEFPLVLSSPPALPNLLKQSAASTAAQMKVEQLNPSDLNRWNYSVNYNYQSGAQDSARIWIVLNEQKVGAKRRAPLHPLFAPLAQFVTVLKDVLEDFETAIVEMKTSNRLNAGVETAKSASQAFAQMLEPVADGFNRWVNLPPETRTGGALSSMSRSFDIVLESGENGNARIDVINSIPESQTPPIVEFESYKVVPAPDKPEYSTASYNYILTEPAETTENNESTTPETHLSYEKALNISGRTITLKELNVFTTQNALGNLQVARNAASKLKKINDLFKFSSPTVKFPAPLVPSLRFTDFDLGMLEVSSQTLENYLNAFFNSLLKDADGVSLLFKLTVSFSFDLSPSTTDSPRAVLPVAMLPGEIAVPQNDQPLRFVSELAKIITDWAESTEPVFDSTSEYNIQLEIFGEEFSEQAAQTPLFAIDNLFIRTEKTISLLDF